MKVQERMVEVVGVGVRARRASVFGSVGSLRSPLCVDHHLYIDAAVDLCFESCSFQSRLYETERIARLQRMAAVRLHQVYVLG